MHSMKKQVIAAFFGSALLAVPTLTHAQNDSKNASVVVPDMPQENTWEYSIAPYLWLSSINGKSGVNGIVSDVDAPISDILDVLDFAGYLAFEAQKGDWGYYADLQYIKLSGSQSGPQGSEIDKISISMEQFRMEAGIKYRIYHTEKTSIHLMVGAQYTYMATDLRTKGSLNEYAKGSGS